MQTGKMDIVIAEELARRTGIAYEIDYLNGASYLLNPEKENSDGGGVFTESLDSCTLFEETLNDEEKLEYIHDLSVVLHRNGYSSSWHSSYAFATALQRSEAFLRLVNLWEA